MLRSHRNSLKLLLNSKLSLIHPHCSSNVLLFEPKSTGDWSLFNSHKKQTNIYDWPLGKTMAPQAAKLTMNKAPTRYTCLYLATWASQNRAKRNVHLNIPRHSKSSTDALNGKSTICMFISGNLPKCCCNTALFQSKVGSFGSVIARNVSIASHRTKALSFNVAFAIVAANRVVLHLFLATANVNIKSLFNHLGFLVSELLLVGLLLAKWDCVLLRALVLSFIIWVVA